MRAPPCICVGGCVYRIDVRERRKSRASVTRVSLTRARKIVMTPRERGSAKVGGIRSNQFLRELPARPFYISAKVGTFCAGARCF